MAGSVVTTQKDFSAGEVDVTAKRDEASPLTKAGLRQGANGRILASKGWQNRSGRRALFKETGCVEEIQLGPTSQFFLCFGNGTLRVYDSTGANQLFTESGRPWTNTTAKSVVYAVLDKSIYICFTSGVPRVLTWDGSTGFTAADHAETVTLGGQKRTFFYRVSPQNITMLPAARSGAGIVVTFSAGMNLVAGHVGTRMRFCGRQILITDVSTATTGTITIEEPLPGSQVLTFGVDPTPVYNIGDEVQGSITNTVGIITALNAGAKTITVQLLTVSSSVDTPIKGVATNVAFTTSDVVVGISGSLTPSSVGAIGNPTAVSIWDDEVMNTLRGYPQSVSVDQGRLIFTNFPSLPRAIGWSWLGLPNDLYVDASANGAMFELAPNNSQVYFVEHGPDGSEFVFCNNGLWYIPISVTNPLKPGSVVFLPISRDGCANVRPKLAMESLFFISGGRTNIMAVVATGGYTHPYSTNDISELRNHLFNQPFAIAIPTADGSFPERYIYILNADGTMVVGKITTAGNVTSVGGQVNIITMVGWLPWSGVGTVAWVAALGADVIFTSSYAPNGIGAVSLVEILDDSKYLDASILYNAVPAGLPIPGGKGPLWWIPGGTVDLMDGPLGTRMMGTYTIDANGFLIPQNNGGEDLTSVNLVCGQAWTAKCEPFIPAVQAGQDQEQRMWPRKINRFQAYVANSSGFVFQRLYSGQTGATLPAPGTVMKQRRIETWNQGEDPTQPPTLREQSYLDRPIGRAHDPREVIVKDTPGPLTILELSTEVTL